MVRIVEIKGIFVFPIFKNGKSSIEYYAQENNCKWLLDEQCKRAEYVTVFLRNPMGRFISGVHSFIEFERRKNKKLDYDTMLYTIENLRVVNEHFLPQYFWLEKLSKYFKGELVIKSIEDLYNFIPNRNAPAIPKITEEQKNKISKIHYRDLKYDNFLFASCVGLTVPLVDLLKKVKDAVS
jgi:tRNA(Ile)-lysidine synthase TilS/MesJ